MQSHPLALSLSQSHAPAHHAHSQSLSLSRSSTPLHAGSSCVRPAAPPLHQDGWFRFRGRAGAVEPAGRNGRRRAELHLEAGGQVTDAAAADLLTGNRVCVTRWVPVTHTGAGSGGNLDPRRVMGAGDGGIFPNGGG
ncbi:potassium voltage-gated channel subfamily Hmember 1 [Striga asiatica]|uniref:Potassium voltage-gated channel subfamily Hmember 1 n=1 Tax=Striga asiatica TaxID=4170 RepID=A0A5A7RJY6_STRAF|nr:potassium voltage-gated channel subfamily Hmember 1 [Striga asiatica]